MVDFWRSVCDGNQETSTWLRTEVEIMIEQFITTADNNILTLMQSIVRYCLLRLYMAHSTSMADNEQNDVIKAYVRRANNGGSDDAWSTGSIYHSARCCHNISANSFGSSPNHVRERPRTREANRSVQSNQGCRSAGHWPDSGRIRHWMRQGGRRSSTEG
jgi:hypothetical protein